MSRVGGVWVYGCGVAALCVTAPIRAERTADNDLMRRATFVARTGDWFGRRFQLGLRVHWISDTELIHTRFFGGASGRRVAYRLNTRTGRETRIPYLTRALDATDAEVVDAEEASPDGRWLVRSARWEGFTLMQVSGPRRYEVPTQDDDAYRAVYWLPDCRRWVDWLGSNGRTRYLTLGDVQHPRQGRALPICPNSELIASLQRVLSLRRAIAVVEPDKDLDVAARNKSIQIYEFSLVGRKRRKVAQVQVPRGSGEFRCHVSPDGHRIAWDVAVRLAGDKCRTEIWVCDLNGHHMHLIGSVMDEHVEPTDPAPSLYVHWLPSGRRLAFTWRNCLYTVPVARQRPAHGT